MPEKCERKNSDGLGNFVSSAFRYFRLLDIKAANVDIFHTDYYFGS
jgi:trans-aconitate methyltransferase